MSSNEHDSPSAGRPATDDPYTEGPDSTVDDWLGQAVERDSERAYCLE